MNVTTLPILGKTLTKIERTYVDEEKLIFHCSDGTKYKMQHHQD